jgi:NAD(P)-dependent dehydrogenase (short-subunit alcohol dehydrogenase family)
LGDRGDQRHAAAAAAVAGAAHVNVSSHAASLTLTGDPDSPMAGFASAAYAPSKTALNALTVQYAKELRNDGTTDGGDARCSTTARILGPLHCVA